MKDDDMDTIRNIISVRAQTREMVISIVTRWIMQVFFFNYASGYAHLFARQLINRFRVPPELELWPGNGEGHCKRPVGEVFGLMTGIRFTFDEAEAILICICEQWHLVWRQKDCEWPGYCR